MTFDACACVDQVAMVFAFLGFFTAVSSFVALAALWFVERTTA